MSKSTGISWTEKTWNPTVGCSLYSPGCTNCYAMFRAHSISQQDGKAGEKYKGLTKIGANGLPVWNGEIRMADTKTLDQPYRWSNPSMIFVNSMSDWAHEGLADEDVFKIFDVMMANKQHVYQILTKRADRMLTLSNAYLAKRGLDEFDHIWFGVSVEDQRRADLRIPILSQVRAKIRFLSMEPLLGPVSLFDLPEVEWVILGGESIDNVCKARGERARPFKIAWAKPVLDFCNERNIAFHMKQLGDNPTDWEKRTPKGDTLLELPLELQVRDYPDFEPRQGVLI